MDMDNLTPQQIEDCKTFARACAESLEQGKLGAFLGHTETEYRHIESRAFQMYSQGRHDKATTLLEGLIALDEHRYYPYLLLGEVCLKQADYFKALDLFRAAEQLEGENVTVISKLGEAYMRTGQVGLAVRYFERVIADESTPKDHASKRRSSVLLGIANKALAAAA